MLSEETVFDYSMNVLPDGQIQIQEATFIMRDGVRDSAFAPRYHRYVLSPGDDVSGKAARIVALAAAMWTPDVISAFRAAQ